METYQPLDPKPTRKAVVVVGAGPAGLTCAHELTRVGHDVTVLEARDRPGGRVWTMRAPLPSGTLAEVGATFLHNNHPLPMHYAAAFGLPLVPLPIPGPRPRLFIGGVPLSPDAGGLFAPVARVLRALVERQGGWPPATGPAGNWEPFDQLSLAELLRREGMSDSELTLASLSLLGNLGDGIETISALAAVRQLSLQNGRTSSFVIEGGNDRLTTAFAERLGERVRFRSQVTGLSQDANGIRVGVRGPAGEIELQADRVVVAIPGPALARVTVSPAWGEARTIALRQQRWTAVIRIFLTVERRFWDPALPGLVAISERPTVRWIVGPAPVGERDVLTAYVMGAAARELAALGPEDRAAWARAEASRVFPEWTEAASAAESSHSWDTDPFAGGGYPWPAPGDDRLPEILAIPDGRIHFAGEHTTHHYGWIQGAMESGLRAAREVHETP